MEREVGGGIGMGNTCKPMAVSFQCMTKSTTKKKKKESGACGRQNSKMASKIPSSPAPHGHGHRSPGYVNLRDFTLWLGYITWYSCLSGREIIPWA